jgi:hypothetical protein
VASAAGKGPETAIPNSKITTDNHGQKSGIRPKSPCFPCWSVVKIEITARKGAPLNYFSLAMRLMKVRAGSRFFMVYEAYPGMMAGEGKVYKWENLFFGLGPCCGLAWRC